MKTEKVIVDDFDEALTEPMFHKEVSRALNQSHVYACLGYHSSVFVKAYKLYAKSEGAAFWQQHRHVTLSFHSMQELILASPFGKDAHRLLEAVDVPDGEEAASLIHKARELFAAPYVRMGPPLHPKLSSLACLVESPEDDGLIHVPPEDRAALRDESERIGSIRKHLDESVPRDVFDITFMAVHVNPDKYRHFMKTRTKKVAREMATEIATAKLTERRT